MMVGILIFLKKIFFLIGKVAAVATAVLFVVYKLVERSGYFDERLKIEYMSIGKNLDFLDDLDLYDLDLSELEDCLEGLFIDKKVSKQDFKNKVKFILSIYIGWKLRDLEYGSSEIQQDHYQDYLDKIYSFIEIRGCLGYVDTQKYKTFEDHFSMFPGTPHLDQEEADAVSDLKNYIKCTVDLDDAYKLTRVEFKGLVSCYIKSKLVAPKLSSWQKFIDHYNLNMGNDVEAHDPVTIEVFLEQLKLMKKDSEIIKNFIDMMERTFKGREYSVDRWNEHAGYLVMMYKSLKENGIERSQDIQYQDKAARALHTISMGLDLGVYE